MSSGWRRLCIQPGADDERGDDADGEEDEARQPGAEARADGAGSRWRQRWKDTSAAVPAVPRCSLCRGARCCGACRAEVQGAAVQRCRSAGPRRRTARVAPLPTRIEARDRTCRPREASCGPSVAPGRGRSGPSLASSVRSLKSGVRSLLPQRERQLQHGERAHGLAGPGCGIERPLPRRLQRFFVEAIDRSRATSPAARARRGRQHATIACTQALPSMCAFSAASV